MGGFLVVNALLSCRYVLGEGIEKKAADLSADIEEQKKSFEEAAAKKAAAAPAEEAPAAEADTEDKPAVQASLWVRQLLLGLAANQRDVSEGCCQPQTAFE